MRPAPLELDGLSDASAQQYLKNLGRQIAGHGATPMLWDRAGLGGEVTVDEYQTVATELARRGALDPAQRFPVPDAANGDYHLRNAFVTLAAVHEARTGSADPRAGTWLGDALTAAKSGLVAEWQRGSAVDVPLALQAAVTEARQSRSQGEATRMMPGLDADFRAGRPLQVRAASPAALEGLHAFARQQLPQAEFWAQQPEYANRPEAQDGVRFLRELLQATTTEAQRRGTPLP